MRGIAIALGCGMMAVVALSRATSHSVFADANDYAAKVKARPYTERDLAQEYGLGSAAPLQGDGSLDYMGTASTAHNLKNCLEAEASRILIEFEENAGPFGAMWADIDAKRIARHRFEDQGLLPRDGD